jgi:flagellar biosynthesis protein FlhG
MDQANRLRGEVLDLKTEAVKLALRNNRTKQGPPPRNPIRVISFTSGKGGVGKTHVVANLALALCRMRKRVLILDADLGLANMNVMLGLNPRYTIQNVLNGEKRIEEVIVTAPGGFKLLPAASGIQELTELGNYERLFLLNELDSIQDRFDMLLIDTAAGISSNVMYFNFAAMEKVVVVTNEPTSLTDAYALIKVLSNKYHQKRFKVLVNSANSASEANKIYRSLGLVADQFLGSPSLDYLGWIPYDEMVRAAIRKQKAVLQLYPNTPASKSFMVLARKLIGKGEDQAVVGDLRFFWRKLLKV